MAYGKKTKKDEYKGTMVGNPLDDDDKSQKAKKDALKELMKKMKRG